MTRRKVNLLFLHPDMSYGGAERQLINLLSGVVQLCRCKVFVAVYRSEGMLWPELNGIKNIQVVDLAVGEKWFGSRVIALKRLIVEQKIEIVYSFLEGPNLLSASARILGSRHRAVWGYRVSSFRAFEFGVKGLFASFFSKVMFAQVDLMIANSTSGFEQLLARKFAPDKLKMIPNGINLQRFRTDPVKRAQYRATMKLASDRFVIGTAGRIVKWKGHDTFLRAAAILKKFRPDAIFVIVGTGDQAWIKYLHDLADELGLSDAVRWQSASTNIEEVLNGLDLLTVTSRSGEGFPNIIGEAMATGVVVVGTDVGETAELLKDVGLVFRPDDHQTLAKLWQQLASNAKLRTNLAAASRAKIVRSYSTERMVADTGMALETVIRKIGISE